MSDVYLVKSPLNDNKISSLLTKLDLSFIKPNSIIGIKVHWGEENNETYIPPNLILPIINEIKNLGALPFITDTLTLYKGQRRDAISTINLAKKHGFNFKDVPIIIADGIRGENTFTYKFKTKHFDSFDLPYLLKEVDGFIIVSHIKGHMESGFGGALKNLGMGFASRKLKQQIHAEVKPQLKKNKCVACEKCVPVCPVNAIKINDSYAQFDLNLCIGCATCIAICPYDAIKIQWETEPIMFLEKLMDSANAVWNIIKGKSIYLNYIINFTEECDCMGYKQDIILEDIGLLGSDNPLSIDLMSKDLVNAGKVLKKVDTSKYDFIRSLHPEIPYLHQFDYCEKIGLGKANYNKRLCE